MSGGICMWTQLRTGKWRTTCGGTVAEQPRPGKACPWCGMSVAIDELYVAAPSQEEP